MALWDEYVWIVVVGALMAFFMAYGIGANDVANAFATSVGSKTLTLFQACVLAAIFEFLGALLLGRGVTSTVKSGIIKAGDYSDAPEVLMYGMLCALTAAGSWLLLATYLELPVSTTHSIIGGLVGFSLVAKGGDSVIWFEIDEKKEFPIKGITAVVISWIFSPVASGIVAVFFFLTVRYLILRTSDSYNRAFMFLPVLVLLCVFINAFYVLDKGIDKQLDQTTETSAWVAAVIAVAAGLLTAIATIFLKKRLENRVAKAAADEEAGIEPKKSEKSSFFHKLSNAINSNDPHGVVDEDAAVRGIHDNAEVFEDRTESVFRYLQVLTSCCDSFAHGANDVANAIGPFSAIWAVYRKNQIEKDSAVPVWILIIGGGGIVVGLATYGYTIIRAIGVKMTKITPSRGFTIELGSALVVVTGSYLGLPLSTTHCQVGATVFVGLVEGAKGVAWSVVGKAIAGWIFTLIIVGFISALLMALGIFTPNLRSAEANVNIKEAVLRSQTNVLDRLNGNCPDPAYQANLMQTRGVLEGSTEENYLYPNRVADIIEYTTQLHIDSTVPACTPPNFTPIEDVIGPDVIAQYPFVPPEVEVEEAA